MDTSKIVEEVRRYVAERGLDATIKCYAAALESWPGEPAGLWLRVSSGGQDEANQLPDVLGHCAGHGYRPAVWYVQHDKSASRGEQQDEQDKAVEEMREGVIKPLVCWDSDRVERRGPEALFRFLRRIKDAGGRLESTTEPLLGTEDLSGEAVTALNAVIAHQKSVHLAEQVKLGHDRIRAGNGLMLGGIPWGYKVTAWSPRGWSHSRGNLITIVTPFPGVTIPLVRREVPQDDDPR